MSTAAKHLVGVDGPAVVVPARVAAWLSSRANLSALRVQARGVDPEVADVLLSLHLAALAWRTSATGSEVAAEPEVAEPLSQWLSTTQAADQLNITDRAVRLAINEGRLPAQQVAGKWRITREDVQHYRAARAA